MCDGKFTNKEFDNDDLYVENENIKQNEEIVEADN